MDDEQPAAGGRGARRRGELRVYLGAAPGVGKTYAMLDEARRRVDRGTDVVVAVVETHGRTHTADLLSELEIVPRRRVEHRGVQLDEMDVDAVLSRRPQTALVDELAHTNAPGSRHEKRWQDVEDLLAAGIDVVTTVNIQHLESLNDVVATITGVRQRETVPDHVVRAADQIQLVDMSPQALRRRLAHGNVYAAEQVDAALSSYFRVGNLTALRELALLWTADRVDDALERYRVDEGIDQPWPARERVVVASAGSADTDVLIRRGARIVERVSGGELLVVHVIRGDGLGRSRPADLARQQALAEALGGSWHTVVADDVPSAVLDFAHGVNATQLVVGVGRRGRLARLIDPGPASALIDGSGDVDVQVVTLRRPDEGHRSRRQRRSALGRTRTAWGWVFALGGTFALTVVLRLMGHLVGLPTVLMTYLALTVTVALIGGLRPALVTAVGSGLVANYEFTPPVNTFTISDPENALAIAVLIGVAAAVSTVVDAAARRTTLAARANATAETLTALAGSVIRSRDTVGALLDHVVAAFGLDAAEVQRRDGDAWVTVRRVGAASGTGSTVLSVDEHLRVLTCGPPLSPSDLRVLDVVGLQAAAALERDDLREQAAAGRVERERGATRTALLAAVSHDLRTPLAAIKAGVGTLRTTQVELADEDRRVLLDDVATSTDRLQALIDNLLDMSRIDAGAVVVRRARVGLGDVVAMAVAGLPRDQLVIDIGDDVPEVDVDAGLLERAVGNLVENALRHGLDDDHERPVRITAGAAGSDVLLRIVDHGPGVPPDRREAIFAPFQRGGDRPGGHGVGLGLAVARGFVHAVGGTLEADDTPGGGLTMIVRLPVPTEGP